MTAAEPSYPASPTEPPPEPILLTGTLVDGGRRTPNAAVVLSAGEVAYAGPRASVPPAWRGAAVPDGWRDDTLLLPGLVDAHQHGAAGGEYGPDAAACRAAIAHHHAHGTTTVVASLVSAQPERLVAGVGACAALVAEGALAGIHLEGPFLSTARRGAQDPAALTDVDLGLVARVVDAAAEAGAPGAVAQWTFAPERGGADDLPAVLAAAGVVGAIGHTDASAAQARRALTQVAEGGGRGAARGGRALATHVFNGMRPLHHRDPGPIAACLAAAARGEAALEVIGDGVHLDAATVRMLFDLVGASSICLITDAMAACGMPDGRYRLGGQEVVVSDRTVRLAEGDSIAGGVATLLDVVRWCVQEACVPLEDAVTAATATPAAVLALPDAGTLAVGSPGDVLALAPDLTRRAVYRRGSRLA